MTKAITKRRHTIERIHYERGVPSEEAPIECDCGWTGRAGDFVAHRIEVGARSNKAALASHPHTTPMGNPT